MKGLASIIRETEGSLAVELALFLPILFLFVLTAFDFFRFSLAERELSTALASTVNYLQKASVEEVGVTDIASNVLKKEISGLGVKSLDVEKVTLTISSFEEIGGNSHFKKATATAKTSFSSLISVGSLKAFPEIQVAKALFFRASSVNE
ncbi:hypothetical protein GUA87_10575 [Sneathiella sp. P13V-1]|uniref:TadE/TadG family type IV pilus assembly protein n=1 Tax=Sneathiella sp. P13V-1 TaxID=2697366 RepID=UPI00187B916A|nr:TadE family protein [Sneathiella sp. P13V-1]MBE7637290.1 hypothetical protein [Sneathiella sp. P13V-1]